MSQPTNIPYEDENGKILIRLQLIQLNPDPAPYKPYSPQFKPTEEQPIQIEIPILKRYVKEYKPDGTIVLSTMGLAKLAKTIATSIAKVHELENEE
jgi:hypothetical protein